MKKFLIGFFILSFGYNNIYSQRNCGTMQYLSEQIEKNPSLKINFEKTEHKLQQWINNNNTKTSNVITIPVVVHVVYYNSNENISDQQIFSQIDIINEDFRRLNADTINTPSAFQSVAADTEIEFCLASEDPNGNTTTGITRTATSQSSFSTNDGVKYSSSGGVDAWNTSEYLNIWVCDLSGGLLGYAQFPGGTASSDGVVCDYAYFGNMGTATSPYDQGRTLTHEIGHWLNLRHIWGDSFCGNDFCNDTPEHSGSNYGCPNFPSTSNCNGNGSSGDMFMNYMDYTDDACMNIFTNDQKTRMIAAINTSRSGLLTSNGCSNADYGCTDQAAYNYSPVAIFNDGSCCYDAGCMDPTAVNYNPTVCYDDGSCIAPVLGCTDPSASNYDASANTTIASGGAIDNTFGTGGYFNGDQHLIFDATKECIIRSATIYSEANNSITFELRNSGGVVIDDTTLSVSSGQQIVNLNFEVPIGNDMQLGVAQGALQNVGLYRNNASASYPYDIASAINITSSSAGGNGGANAFIYYYFYYDIEVETPCQGTGTGTASWDCDGQGNCFDPGTGNGQYASLNQCQSSCITPTWDCDGQGNCFDPGTGNGQYTSLNQCQSSCITPTWDCDGQGNCFDPGTGNGQYASLNQCQSSCITPTWDCDGQGNCFDPGTGNGQYTSLNQCQSSCITPTWDCDGGTCFDPGNGMGLYATLNDCEAACTNVGLEVFNLEGLKIYPNPSSDIFNIEFSSIRKQTLNIRIYNSLGKNILEDHLNDFSGSYNQKFNLKYSAKGVYFLEITTNQGIINKKLILK